MVSGISGALGVRDKLVRLRREDSYLSLVD